MATVVAMAATVTVDLVTIAKNPKRFRQAYNPIYTCLSVIAKFFVAKQKAWLENLNGSSKMARHKAY